MIGSLDRTLEEDLIALLDVATDIQCVPNLMGADEDEAIVPRIAVWCESQESPEFQETPEGIYGVFPVTTVVTCIAEATSSASSADMEEMVDVVDTVLDDDLVTNLTSGGLDVFGVVEDGIRQECQGNRMLRHRELTIWARLP